MKGTEPYRRNGRKPNGTSSEIAFGYLPVPIGIAFKSLENRINFNEGNRKGTERAILSKKT